MRCENVALHARALNCTSMNNRPLTLAALVLLFALAIIAFSVGRFAISPSDLLTIVWAKLSGGTHALPAPRL